MKNLMRVVLLPILLWSGLASSQLVTSPYPPPLGASLFTGGTSLYPVYQKVNSGNAPATGTVTANSLTFTCATICQNFYVGGSLYGGDGSGHLIWLTAGGQIGAQVTALSGTCTASPVSCVVTTNVATNPAVVPGTYQVQVGKNRASTTSTIDANTVQALHIYTGTAALGNSTWVQSWLAGVCDDPTVTNACLLFGGASAASFYNVLVGARASDTTSGSIENLTTLCINDNTSVSTQMWCHYDQMEILPSSGQSQVQFAHEVTMINGGSQQVTDPFSTNVGGQTTNMRLDCGQGNQPFTTLNCSDALEILGLNGTSYETGILFSTSALDHGTLTHPSAISVPCGANGYAISGYKASGFSTPSWQIFCTNTTNNGNQLVLGDSAVSWNDATNTYFNATKTQLIAEVTGASAVFNAERLDVVASGGAGTFRATAPQANGTVVVYGELVNNITSNANGAQTGSWSIRSTTAGTTNTYMSVSGANGVNILAGAPLQMSSSTVIDTSKNITAANISGTGLISNGTKFTTTGCSVSTTTGGATAGTFTLGANTCTVVITMNGATGLTAPNGWTCQAHDRTAITNVVDGESSSTTATASIVIPATAGATDVISFSCTGF